MLGTKRPASTGTGPLPPRGPAPSPPAGTATLRWLRLSGPQGWDTGPLPAEGSCAPAPVPSQVPPHLWPCSHVPTHLTRCPCNCLCPPCLSRCPHTQPGVSIPDLVPACPPTCHHARSHPPHPGQVFPTSQVSPRLQSCWLGVPMPGKMSPCSLHCMTHCMCPPANQLPQTSHLTRPGAAARRQRGGGDSIYCRPQLAARMESIQGRSSVTRA